MLSVCNLLYQERCSLPPFAATSNQRKGKRGSFERACIGARVSEHNRGLSEGRGRKRGGVEGERDALLHGPNDARMLFSNLRSCAGCLFVLHAFVSSTLFLSCALWLQNDGRLYSILSEVNLGHFRVSESLVRGLSHGGLLLFNVK